MANNINYQQQFLRTLEKKLGGRSKMLPHLMEELNLGKDAVYRRLRGTTAMTADELLHLAEIFDVSLPSAPPDARPAQVSRSPREFFTSMNNVLANILEEPRPLCRSVTPEMPLEYELALPNLRAFKLFIYGITTWQVPAWREVSFVPRLLHPEVNKLVDEFVGQVFRFPGKQLLSPNLFDITIRQMKYLVQVGRFNDRDALFATLDELDGIADHLEKMVDQGERFLPGQGERPGHPRFEIYVNDLPTSAAIVIKESERSRMLLTSTMRPNYLLTSHPATIDQTLGWYNHLVANATQLGDHSPTYTSTFFTRLRRKVAAARQTFKEEIGFDLV